jgi:hypothetical protein
MGIGGTKYIVDVTHEVLGQEAILSPHSILLDSPRPDGNFEIMSCIFVQRCSQKEYLIDARTR